MVVQVLALVVQPGRTLVNPHSIIDIEKRRFDPGRELCMIKPEDTIRIKPNSHDARMSACESQFDDAIACAMVTSQWPARVPDYRDMMPSTVVDAVSEKYRAAGWDVYAKHGARALIRRRSVSADVIAPGPGLTSQQMLDEAARALGWRTDFACGDSPITWELVLDEISALARRDRIRKSQEQP